MLINLTAIEIQINIYSQQKNSTNKLDYNLISSFIDPTMTSTQNPTISSCKITVNYITDYITKIVSVFQYKKPYCYRIVLLIALKIF